LSADQVQELTTAYARGVAINDLADRFGINRSTVLEHLKRSQTRRRYPALDARCVEEAAVLYRSGLALADIGSVFEVHATTVRLALLRVGVEMRDCQGRARAQTAITIVVPNVRA
jgi:IS30 family transposase